MELNGIHTRKKARLETVKLMIIEFEEALQAYGKDFSFNLMRELAGYLKMERGIFLATSIEGRFILEMRDWAKERMSHLDPSPDEVRYMLSELQSYIATRVSIELERVVEKNPKTPANQIDRRKGKFFN